MKKFLLSFVMSFIIAVTFTASNYPEATQNNPALTSVSSISIQSDGKPYCTGIVIERVEAESLPSRSSGELEALKYYCSTGNRNGLHFCYVEIFHEGQLVSVIDQCPYTDGKVPLSEEDEDKGVVNVPYPLGRMISKA